MSKMKLSPFWYAIGGLFAVPICAIICFVWSIFILLIWPAVPFIFYFKRRKELKEEKTK